MAGIRRVVNGQLDLFTPAPGVPAQLSSNVQRHAARAHQQIAKWLTNSTEGNCFKTTTVASFKHSADMRTRRQPWRI